MDWDKVIVRRTMELATDNEGALLQFILQRLEAYPDALPAIADAVDDLSALIEHHANALQAEVIGRAAGAQIIPLSQK